MVDFDPDELPDTLGPARKRTPVDLPNLTPEELEKVNASLIVPGGPRIPDAPDISPTPPEAEPMITDEEFFAGNRYKPHGRKSRSGVTFEIVEHAKESQHLAFEQSAKLLAEKRGIKPPPPTFYVRSKHGTIGWVPWIGSVIAWPWELGWEADLVEKGDPDPKPERKT